MSVLSSDLSPSLQSASAPTDAQATDVLRHYTGAEFVFVSPTTALIASGFAPELTVAAGDTSGDLAGIGSQADMSRRAVEVASDVKDLFARARDHGVARPVLVGAVPFDIHAAPRLAIAQTCRLLTHSASSPASTTSTKPAAIGSTGSSSMATVPAASSLPSATHVAKQVPIPATSVYEAAVSEALALFSQDTLDKVVLARTLALTLDAPLDLPALVARLLAKNARGYTYAVPLATPGEVFLGATPELLVRRAGSRVMLNPLAGSAARVPDHDADRAVGQALLQSQKDLQEHAIVIDEIATVLRPLCRTLTLPAGPELVATDALWHLSTVIEGELIDPTLTSLDLAFALHPTPAVCGHPRQAAFDTIVALEPFDRGYFAGFVGWMSHDGDGEWAVSLRCAQVGPQHATLYAGAGIVPGSVPQRETAETQTKFRTMLSALGLGHSINQR